MFKLGKKNQVSVYIAEDVVDKLLRFSTTQPLASVSAIVNAALRMYLAAAEHGVDGRLVPINRDDVKTEFDTATLRAVIEEILERRVAVAPTTKPAKGRK